VPFRFLSSKNTRICTSLWLSGLVIVVPWLSGCGRAPDWTRKTGVLQLPDGVLTISAEVPAFLGVSNLTIRGSARTTLLLSPSFQGRAALIFQQSTNVRIENLTILRNEPISAPPSEMAPPENAFRLWHKHNGILADQVDGLEIHNVRFQRIAGFPILVSRSRRVSIEAVSIQHSGSLNRDGKNNTTGGILLEEGTEDFSITRCDLRHILGNGIWTHSLYTSPRNARGVIAGNHFEEIGRDAIQVGHATQVQVVRNSGTRIGYPQEVVDLKNEAIPVAIDTAGNVDFSAYNDNQFAEINGKCFDLDGFHHGEVRRNTCINRSSADAYPSGGFALVMNNNNPDMRSEAVTIAENLFSGAKFGAVYLIGRNHRVVNNRFERLNLARCTENAARFGCYYLGDANLLRSGIYLGRGVRRLEQTRDNIVENNLIQGWKMKERCLAAGPGVSLRQNFVRQNNCLDDPPPGL
jgi:hypothetical protein